MTSAGLQDRRAMAAPAPAYDVLVAGAGHAGAQIALALRQRKFAGTIGLIGEEPDWPYERPPLSKEYLAREKEFERILIRPADSWKERDVDVVRGTRVVGVEPDAHAVVTDRGGTIGYKTLVWAAGGTPRRLSCPGGQLDGVHVVRARDDVDRLMSELDRGASRFVIIGAGYIGLEAAAVLAKLGKQVVVVEAQERVLARVAGRELGAFILREHRAHGVEIRLGASVERLEGDEGRVTGVRLADGERLVADAVIVGIGITPAVEPLLAAGAEGGNGVLVDEYCRTSLPDIYAVGDCALHRNPFAAGAAIRLESVQNANDMATTAAASIVGAPQPYASVPWFWSNQYDLRLQTVGLAMGFDEEIVRGDPASRSFSVVYLRGGKVVALDCVNAVKDYVQGRSLVLAGASAPRAQLADPACPLKSLTVEAL